MKVFVGSALIIANDRFDVIVSLMSASLGFKMSSFWARPYYVLPVAYLTKDYTGVRMLTGQTASTTRSSFHLGGSET